ncbi:MAG: hypothetical protein K2M89_06405 [Clostridiales bacterium]|nr:hypothetical protein [Clostridiales bacterium]
MVIFLNPDGTAEKVTPEHVYQGSNNVIDITVIAPYSMSTAIQIGFILPNGLYWTSPAPENARYAPMEFVGPSEENGTAGAWSFVLPISVTEQVGEVQVAINAIGTTGNTTSYLCQFTVEESVLPNLPDASPEPSVYDLIQQYLARLDGRTANVPNLVASIQKASGNSFIYTDNKGVVSAPIALGVVDYDPTYVGVVSVIELPESAWGFIYNSAGTLIGYGITIPAAQHGQMRDGVAAEDLMVNFKRVSSGGTYGQYNATYSISRSGDITVTSTSIGTNPALVAIIWNGKGLADVTARNEIAAETTARESADANLQQQIDEIVDRGVDKTAREQIAAEIAARESADAELQSDINAERTRAQSAEQGLQNAVNTNASNIEELREDVDEIDSYIPSSTSASNKLADQAFVNSSINNLAAFYITSNAQGDAFTTRAALLSAATYYYGGQARTPTQNDYAIVLADESQPLGVDGKYPTTRYSYQGLAWSFQYVLNNTSLTQAQVNAINSGITAQKIANMDAATADKYTKPSSGIPESDLSETVQEKINKAAPVYSVNGKTGAVALTAADVAAFPNSGGTVDGSIIVKGGIVQSDDAFKLTRASGDTYYYATRTDTGNEIKFGIGSGGQNRGIWDGKLNKWVFHIDSSGKVYVNGVVPYSSSNPPQKTGGLVDTADRTTVLTNAFNIHFSISLTNLGFTANQKYIGGMLFIYVGDAYVVAYVDSENSAIVTYNGGVGQTTTARRYQSSLHYFTTG